MEILEPIPTIGRANGSFLVNSQSYRSSYTIWQLHRSLKGELPQPGVYLTKLSSQRREPENPMTNWLIEVSTKNEKKIQASTTGNSHEPWS